jgi:hypothetical protein
LRRRQTNRIPAAASSTASGNARDLCGGAQGPPGAGKEGSSRRKILSMRSR